MRGTVDGRRRLPAQEERYGLGHRMRAWLREPPSRQGRHVDPVEQSVADPARWPPLRRTVYTSPEMTLFRAGLVAPSGGDERTGVLDDLAVFYDLDPAECLARCLEWEAASVAEWNREDRSSDEARLRFYQSTQSWAFDLLWWAYLQAAGHGEPQAAIAAYWVSRRLAGRRHLDFGSGAGTTAQLFSALGFESTLADVSSSLLDFARFRIERRGGQAAYRDLGISADLGGPYDVITAIDTLAHVPDIRTTATTLWHALARGGFLVAGLDARPPSPENAWHLQDDELECRYLLQRVGFRPEHRLGSMLIAYRRVDPSSIGHRCRAVPEWLAFGSPRSRALQQEAKSAARAAIGRVRRW